MASVNDTEFQKMTQAPIRPLVVRLAFPTVVSMLITSLYNMADTWFVSQIGTSASGAVGIVFSIMAIIQAIGFMLGMGAGSLISRTLGEQDPQRASRIASSAFAASLLFGLLLTVGGLLLLDDLMVWLGATKTILPYARDYARYILLGAPVMSASFVLNNLLRAEGKARFSMVGLTLGGVLNILLDPYFIFVLDLETAGAAMATLLSQTVSFLIMLSFFLTGKSTLRLRPQLISRQLRTYWEIAKTGAPSLCRQGLASVSSILLNTNAAAFGDCAVSAMSIVSKLFMLMFCVGLGIGQGYQPIAGYNYGAQKWGRVREACLFVFCVNTAVLSVLGLSAAALAPQIMTAFIDDPQVVAIGTQALRFQGIAMPFLALNMICNMTFQATGQRGRATLLSCCRQGLFFVPAALALPALWKVTGVTLIQPVSDLCTFTFSLPFFFAFLKDIRRRITEQKAAA